MHKCALKAQTSHTKPLPEAANELLTQYEAARKEELEELFGEAEEGTDPVYERVATTAKQLAKLDESKRLLDPPDLAMTHLEAMLDNEKKEALLEKAFGKKLGDDRGEKRNREGSVLAKYAPVSAVASEEEKEDEVMADADPPEASDSDEEDQE